jgi:AcrR family transcriptional regulator
LVASSKIPQPRPSVRERLLAAADELFDAEGVHSVGIDRVIDRAGAAKASLYRTFGSKEDLVAAYLDARHLAIRQYILAAVELQSEPRARLLAVFDAQAQWLERATYHGCSFTRASAEPSAGEKVHRETARYRQDVQAIFTRLAADADVGDAATLGIQLFLLYQGASAIPSNEQQAAMLLALRAAARSLIDAAVEPVVSGE